MNVRIQIPSLVSALITLLLLTCCLSVDVTTGLASICHPL